MLRRSITRLAPSLRRASALRRWNFSEEAATQALGVSELPQVDPADPAPEYISLTVACPHKTLIEEEPARLVTVPGLAGAFGVAPNHVPVLCEMQPGILSVFFEKSETAGKQVHYFVAGGFAIMHPNSAMEIACVEAVDMNDLDSAAVAKGLAAARDKFSQADKLGETAKAEAEIEVVAYEAIQAMMGYHTPGTGG